MFKICPRCGALVPLSYFPNVGEEVEIPCPICGKLIKFVVGDAEGG